MYRVSVHIQVESNTPSYLEPVSFLPPCSFRGSFHTGRAIKTQQLSNAATDADGREMVGKSSSPVMVTLHCRASNVTPTGASIGIGKRRERKGRNEGKYQSGKGVGYWIEISNRVRSSQVRSGHKCRNQGRGVLENRTRLSDQAEMSMRPNCAFGLFISSGIKPSNTMYEKGSRKMLGVRYISSISRPVVWCSMCGVVW